MLNRSHETWDSLLDLIDTLQEIFQEFLALLCEEEQLLLKMDRQQIAGVTERKEQVLDAMCRYEQQVMSVLEDLAGPENLEAIGQWLKNVHEPQAVLVNERLHELMGVAHKIQAQGKKNEAIIRRTQHVVGEAINLIYTGLGNGPVYQGSGTLQAPSVLSSVHLHG